MNHRKILIAVLSGAILLSGCSSPMTGAGDLMKSVVAAERPANPPLPAADFTDAVTSFSLRLFQASLSDRQEIFLSPASVYLALAMTMNGAENETLAEMREALSSSALEEALINEGSRDWMTRLSQSGEKTELFISNALWIREGYPINQAFLKRNADYYGAAAYALDFSNPSNIDIINQWVRQATRDKIDKIIDDIDPDVMMYLMNAISFKADWETPFNPESNQEGLFKTPQGDETVIYMNRTDRIERIQDNEVNGVWLPYEDDVFAFFALMPDSSVNLNEWAADLTVDEFSALLNKREPVSITLTFPKFEVTYEDSLLNELSALGVQQAFSDVADFSRMNEQDRSDLFISEIKHKTYCRVDEKGTEAAAVTSVEMRLTSMPVAEETLVFDHPFLYGIMDVQTGIPLFLGTMEKPEFTD